MKVRLLLIALIALVSIGANYKCCYWEYYVCGGGPGPYTNGEYYYVDGSGLDAHCNSIETEEECLSLPNSESFLGGNWRWLHEETTKMYHNTMSKNCHVYRKSDGARVSDEELKEIMEKYEPDLNYVYRRI